MTSFVLKLTIISPNFDNTEYMRDDWTYSLPIGILYGLPIAKADTVVVYEGVIREKPATKEEARQFLKDYSGRRAATAGFVLVTNLKTCLRILTFRSLGDIFQ
ncbi:Maf protein [Spatholobus suberectus]|nr:Maf protein [Spatholobus suberectus]